MTITAPSVAVAIRFAYIGARMGSAHSVAISAVRLFVLQRQDRALLASLGDAPS